MTVICDFCGKSQDGVGLMVVAENSRAICNECVHLSVEIILFNAAGKPWKAPSYTDMAAISGPKPEDDSPTKATDGG